MFQGSFLTSRFLSSVALVFSVCLAAQDRDAPPSFRVTSELVLVELVVTDSDGNFVPELGESEIFVWEDGKKQKISHFELFRVITGDMRGDETTRASDPVPQPDAQRSNLLQAIPRDETSFAAPSEGVLVVIAVDLASIGQLPMDRVLSSVRDFMNEHLGPDDRVMLASIGSRLRIDQSLTRDHSRILERLKGIRVENAASDETSLARFMDEIESLFRLVSITSNKQILKDSVASVAKNLLVTVENRLASSSESLGLLARSLRSVPGRKHIVLYTAGYPLNAQYVLRDIIEQRISDGYVVDQDLRQHLSAVLGGVQRQEFHTYVQKLIDEANRAQVSLYTIDARGLIAVAAGGESGVRGLRHTSRLGVTNEYLRADVNEPQEYLRNVALGTGGIPFLNSNDLQKGLVRAYRDLHEYYLIGYRPESKRRKGKFHEIKIKVDRPDLDLRYRKGYFEPEDDDSRESEVVDALSYPSLFQAFPVLVETEVEQGKLKVFTLVPTQALGFSQQGSRFLGSVEIFGILVDESGKRLGEEIDFAKRYSWDIDKDQLQQLRQGENAVSAAETEVPDSPGRYRLIVAVRRGLDGSFATASVDLEF